MQMNAPIKAALFSFFKRNNLPIQGRALVGLSGGPDSTALLVALKEEGIGPLRAIHVDHGIRPEVERAAELALVQGLCARLGVPLSVAHIKPGAIETRARAAGIGIEAAAREYRYHVFNRYLEREDAGRIFLAHTENDQVETILLRALGGGGAAGIRGIPAHNGPILRPFLTVSKSALILYLEERGIVFSRDSTNDENTYLCS